MNTGLSQWPLEPARIQGVRWYWNEPMARRTSFRIGGRVRCLALPQNEEAFIDLVHNVHRREIPHVILGAATNVLMPDEFWDVLVIQVRGFEIVAEMADSVEEAVLHFAAGVNLARLQRFCLRRGLVGIEPLVGIPGTVGGALVMNAGTNSGTISKVLDYVDLLDEHGHRRRLSLNELTPGYRSMGLPADWVVVAAGLRLRKGSRKAVETGMREALLHRHQSQPFNKPSAGSIFKNPPGQTAGELIEQAGLKGLTRGDAQISTVHANWIVNLGKAGAEDVLALIETAEEEVDKRFGIRLEREIKVLTNHG